MKFLIVITFIIATLFCVLQADESVIIRALSANEREHDGYSASAYGCTIHAQQRSRQRAIDINQARRNMRKVRTTGDRDIYEGTYTDQEGCRVNFRLVIARNDSSVITAIRLN